MNFFDPRTIRSQCLKVFEQAQAGKTHFNLHLERLPEVSDLVVNITRKRSGPIPIHSRWNHFYALSQERLKDYQRYLGTQELEERVKSSWDLTIISVLLDAGADPRWQFQDQGGSIGRSEGLALASLKLFESHLLTDKAFSVTADGLTNLKQNELEDIFQISSHNPFDHFEGRYQLLLSLGSLLKRQGKSRPSDFLPIEQEMDAATVFMTLAQDWRELWPSRQDLQGKPLGDCWYYAPFGNPEEEQAYIPFHKLTQWLTYSLLDPLYQNGIEVKNLDLLTGLPEYRNGGLFLDGGVLQLKRPEMAQETWSADSELIVEWRALTLSLLDLLFENLKDEFDSLPQLLEGGSWAAGRELAHQKREGLPPLQLKSDGTVF